MAKKNKHTVFEKIQMLSTANDKLEKENVELKEQLDDYKNLYDWWKAEAEMVRCHFKESKLLLRESETKIAENNKMILDIAIKSKDQRNELINLSERYKLYRKISFDLIETMNSMASVERISVPITYYQSDSQQSYNPESNVR